MKKVLVTGSKGTVGKILVPYLESLKYDVTGYDIHNSNIADHEFVLNNIKNYDAIIHLDMDAKVGFSDENYNPDDFTMVYNLLHTATDNHNKRIIMFSSIHADDFSLATPKNQMSTTTVPTPDSPYGAYKIYMEALSKYYSKNKGIEVICIRLGGVTADDRILSDKEEAGFSKVYLSHEDLKSQVVTCIEKDSIINNFELLYGVSNNEGRLHDNSNSIGWKPKL
ncbi:MAG: SDR family oxidoreductase [Candidatus Dojkabacteria bacterium]|nr:SDR family oxidoreductase [Candidatus Dojkabacteria bacterium]MDQ7020273.1 SDR family oxidoreductase [Candidatus Dojkabacteria bacterium]